MAGSTIWEGAVVVGRAEACGCGCGGGGGCCGMSEDLSCGSSVSALSS